MEFRSNSGFFISEPFQQTLKNQFSITALGSNSTTTIYSDLTYRETLISEEDNQHGGGEFQVEEAIPMLGGGSKFSQNSDPVTPPASTSEEVGLQTPTQEVMVRPRVESSSKKKRLRGVKTPLLKPGNVEGADRPEWLPDGWEMVRKQRKNGKSAGLVDTVYYEPVTGRGTGRLFRSKGEVLEFLETGTRRKRKSRPRGKKVLALKGNTKGNDNSDTSKVMVSSLETPSQNSS